MAAKLKKACGTVRVVQTCTLLSIAVLTPASTWTRSSQRDAPKKAPHSCLVLRSPGYSATERWVGGPLSHFLFILMIKVYEFLYITFLPPCLQHGDAEFGLVAHRVKRARFHPPLTSGVICRPFLFSTLPFFKDTRSCCAPALG